MKQRPPSRIEKILYFVSTLIVLGVAGAAMALEASAPDDARAEILAFQDEDPWESDGATAVPWTIRNVSAVDVERVQVAVSIGEEEVTQEVDYLPQGASRSGVAHLPPGAEKPRVEIRGYRLP